MTMPNAAPTMANTDNNQAGSAEKSSESQASLQDDLEYAKNTVFDMDKRIGGVITKSAMSIYNTINNNDNK